MEQKENLQKLRGLYGGDVGLVTGLLDQRMDCVRLRLAVLHGRGEPVAVAAIDADVDVLFWERIEVLFLDSQPVTLLKRVQNLEFHELEIRTLGFSVRERKVFLQSHIWP